MPCIDLSNVSTCPSHKCMYVSIVHIHIFQDGRRSFQFLFFSHLLLILVFLFQSVSTKRWDRTTFKTSFGKSITHMVPPVYILISAVLRSTMLGIHHIGGVVETGNEDSSTTIMKKMMEEDNNKNSQSRNLNQSN